MITKNGKTNLGILENRYAAERNTCDIIKEIHADGAATRALLTQTTIDALRAENESLKLSASQQAQTSNILSTLGKYYTNPPLCNPCYVG